MSLRITIFTLLGALFFSGGFAYAQTEASENDAAAEGERPSMPALFFRDEQRRILEAVRQGVVEQETFTIEGFQPVILDALPDPTSEEAVILGERSQNYVFDSYIVNKSTGDSTFWVNGRVGNRAVLENQGIILGAMPEDESEETDLSDNLQSAGAEGEADAATEAGAAADATAAAEEQPPFDGVFRGVDTFNNSQFEFRVGQSISTEGLIEENYPVVVIKRR